MSENKTTKPKLTQTQFRVLLNESAFILRGELTTPYENGFEKKDFKNGISNINSLRADFFTPSGLSISVTAKPVNENRFSGKRIFEGETFGINFNRIHSSRWGYTLWHLPK